MGDRKPLEMESILEQVRRLGRVAAWAPGGYINKCGTCETAFEGDKRAHQCLPCAVAAKVEHARLEGMMRALKEIAAVEKDMAGETDITAEQNTFRYGAGYALGRAAREIERAAGEG